MAQKRERSQNWDQHEKELLKKIIAQKVDIIENSSTDTNTNKIKKKAWEEIFTIFSAAAGSERKLSQIQVQWRKLKMEIKSKNSELRRSMQRTGGGPAPKPLEAIDEQIISSIPHHFRVDNNMYDSDAVAKLKNIDQTEEIPNSNPMCEVILLDDGNLSQDLIEIEPSTAKKQDCLEGTNSPIQKAIKRKKVNLIYDNEKKNQLLHLSIKQKGEEIQHMKIEHEKIMEKYNIEINFIKEKQNQVQKELYFSENEHKLKMLKLELEIEFMKKENEQFLNI